jgi:hypothetical protein
MLHNGRTTFGWILLIVGGILLFHYWDILELDWMTFLMALGVGLFIAGVLQRDHSAVFPGTFIFLIGLLFYLKDRYILEAPWWDIWPLIILFLGISFVMLYVFNPSRRDTLWPGLILIAVSFFLLFVPWCWYDLFYWIGRLWPVLLILAGLFIILETRKRRKVE